MVTDLSLRSLLKQILASTKGKEPSGEQLAGANIFRVYCPEKWPSQELYRFFCCNP